MKIFISTAFSVLLFSSISAQTLTVSGRNLLDTYGNTVVLRGINYPIIDDYGVHTDNPTQVDNKINQIAQSGANCVRFPWYTNGAHYKDNLDPGTNPGYGPGTLESYVNDGSLSHLLSYTRQQGMIPILEIHDLTGGNNNAIFQSQVMGFWTDPDVLQVIAENEGHLIINLANEYGLVRFTGDQAAASIAFRDNYITSIQTLRGLGVTVPIMIDAPDYGQSSTELVAIANAILAADPLGNIIFSAHAYWYGYANSQAAVETKLNEIEASGTCYILGEIANSQADAPTYCGELDLSALYPIILNESCSRDIGWLAWSWDQDCDGDREMASNGNFSSLTPYGTDIIYNLDYGLLSTSGCGAMPLAENGIFNAVSNNDNPTVCSGENHTIIITAMGGTPPYSGEGTFIVGAGTHTYTVTDSLGESVDVIVVVTELPALDVSVSSVPNELTANASGTMYQWVTCPNYDPIIGETNQTLFINQSGDYAVIITHNSTGCSDTSSCYTGELGINEGSANNLQIFPNPSSDRVQLSFSGNQSTANLTIRNSKGVLVKQDTVTNNEMIDLSNLPAGIYFFELEINQEKVVTRFVKL